MQDKTLKNLADQKNRQLYSNLTNYLIDINELTNDIIVEAISVRQALKPGFPKSVYQLNLFNHLMKKGYKLETGASLLDYCVENEPHRELIMINGVLVIECIADVISINHHKRIMFDLQNNGHEMGLLINFNTDSNNISITRVCHNIGIHNS